MRYLETVRYEIKYTRIKGSIIAIEGIDGSGKDSVINNLNTLEILKELNEKTLKSYITLPAIDNGCEYLSKAVREILKDEHATKEESKYLFLSLIERQTRLANEYSDCGYNVILNRSIISTMVYNDIEDDELVYPYIKPIDCVLYIDVDPKIALERITKRGLPMDKNENIDALYNYKRKYTEVLKNINTNIIIIDGNKPLIDVIQDVRSYIRNIAI